LVYLWKIDIIIFSIFVWLTFPQGWILVEIVGEV
jgi:hypothetical protein